MDLDDFPEDRTKPDFRRVNKGTPFVLGPDGKRTRYSRSSNAGKILDDESNLTDWKLRTVVVGAAQRDDLLAIVSTLDPEADKKRIRDIAEDCLTAGKGKHRANKGTAVHSMFDHLDLGDDWEPAPQFQAVCEAYKVACAEWGLVPVDVEVHCINDQFRLAGTMDRRYRTTRALNAPDGTIVPIGSVVAGDTKTGESLEYAAGSYATQLAAYVDSDHYNVVTDERSPFDPPTFKEWGLIVHAPGERVDIYWVDLEAGRQGLQLAQQVKGWRRAEGLLTLGVLGPEAVALPEASQGPSEAPWPPERVAHLRGRLRALVALDNGAALAMQRKWPVGVPGLKAEGHSAEQLQAIEAVMEQVETQFSAPFHPPWVDPVEESKRNHPSNQVPKEVPWAEHPKAYLITRWAYGGILQGGTGPTVPLEALGNLLGRVASWEANDLELRDLAHGLITACGYPNGLADIGKVTDFSIRKAHGLMDALEAGRGILVWDDKGKPMVREVTQ